MTLADAGGPYAMFDIDIGASHYVRRFKALLAAD